MQYLTDAAVYEKSTSMDYVLDGFDYYVQSNTKDINMYNNVTDTATLVKTRINELKTALNEDYHAKSNNLAKAYGLQDEDSPKNAKDLVARIQSGKYILPEDKYDYYNHNPTENIRWRDPELKEDKDGFKAAEHLLDVAFNDTRLAILVNEPIKGLDILREFKAKTFN